jgi:hypothetical protein
MIGITIVLKTLAKNNPGACSDANNAEINEMIYMEAISIMPTRAAVRFTFFIWNSFLIWGCNRYVFTFFAI